MKFIVPNTCLLALAAVRLSTAEEGIFQPHNVMLKVEFVERDRANFASLVPTLDIKLRESESLKYFEVIIWEETSSVHFYSFPNEFDSWYGYDITSVDADGHPLGINRNALTDEQITAYRERFLIIKHADMPKPWTEESSSFLRAAFVDIASYLVNRYPDSSHHLKYRGHGGPGGRLFVGLLSKSDSYGFLKAWSQALGRPLGVIDMGGPCNKGSFAELDSFCDSAEFYIASDLLNGGYSMDEFTWAKREEIWPLTQYHNLFPANQSLVEALKGRIDLKRKEYEYSRNNMTSNRVAQANYLYSCAAFRRFSPNFKAFLSRVRVNYRILDDLFKYMIDNDAPPTVIEQFNDVLVHKADNKDFFEWSDERHGMLMPGSDLLSNLLLEIVSGDGQEGVPGAALAQPLVVEVRDQYGDLLAGAAITFAVTAGDGKLSGRYSVEHATTDAGGRAELILTLGPNPGPNIVGVSLGGRELATFHAEGVGTAVAEQEGDYRTWHLPKAATVRLGQGALGRGDRAVALSADGRCLAVASGIGVWLYEVAASRALALLPTEGAGHAVAFSLDGTLAAGLEDGRVELWEVETGVRTGTLRHADWGGVTVVFSPDGTRLASGSGDQVIKVWDVETRDLVGTWEVQETGRDEDISVAFSPDGSRLVSGFQDGTVRLWEVATRTEVAALAGHTDRVASVSFSPDGRLLASGGGRDDRTVRLWDGATPTEIATLGGHTDEVRSVSFSPDGRLLASGGGWNDRTVRLWDVAAREETATLEEHGGGIRSVAFSRDGATLVSAAADGTVLLRDVETGNAAGLSGHASLSSMALSPDGALLASGYHDGAIRLWDAATRESIATLEGHTAWVGSVSFSSDGALLASGSWDRTVKLWDVGTRKLVGTLQGHTGGVTSVSFSPDGATLASAGGSSDATIRLWDVATREATGILEGHTNSVQSVAFSPSDGALLASGGGREDKTVKLWEVRDRELIGTLEGPESEINTVAFSPDGKTLASGSYGVRLWDVATRTPIATLPNRGWVGSVAFTPDGQSLVSGSWGPVELWDLETRTRTVTLTGHTNGVHSVAFSRDGATLASGARDGTMLLWNLQPQPQSLTRVPGRQPQGAAGTALAEPFVVLVLDQYGDPLAGATVTFAVTAGGGTLSVTTATTDADGRAATTLTLGRQPGTNTVEATVAGLEPVTFGAAGLAVPRTLAKLSGDEQQAAAGAQLAEALVVSVRDQNGSALPGVVVTFALLGDGGTLSATADTTDAEGLAVTTLTLGEELGTYRVEVSVADLQPVTFTATAEATPDFDGDGVTGFSDFFLFAQAFGGTDPRFDLDGSGTVDLTDFFLFAESFGQPARAKLVAMARELIGLPDGPQLHQNAPNPFNSGTVISWFQLQPGPARLEVYALTGQRVAVLHQGPKKAGLHRVRWDGRDDQGRPLASGVYVYRLVRAEEVQRRKLTLLR